MQSNKIPHVPSLLDELLREYRNNWLHGFLFTSDPIHVQYLLSDSVMSQAVLGQNEATHFAAGTASMSNGGSEISRVKAIQFMVPTITVFPITAGFGAAHLVMESQQSARRGNENSNADMRFAINAETGTMMLLFDSIETSSIRLIHTRRNRDWTFVTRAIFSREGFTKATERDAELNTDILLKHLKYFTYSKRRRICTTCTSAKCVCVKHKDLISSLRPAHPFDTTFFRNAASYHLGAFHGTSENVIFVNGFPVYTYSDSVRQIIDSTMNCKVISHLRDDALARHAHTITYSPRADAHLLEAELTHQLIPRKSPPDDPELKSTVSQDTRRSLSYVRSDSTPYAQRQSFSQKPHGTHTPDISVAAFRRDQEARVDTLSSNRQDFIALGSDPIPILSDTRQPISNESPSTLLPREIELTTSVFVGDMNVSPHALSSVLTSVRDEQAFESVGCEKQENNILYDLLVDPLLNNDSAVEKGGGKKEHKWIEDQNDKLQDRDGLNTDGVTRMIYVSSEPTEPVTSQSSSHESRVPREASVESSPASVLMPHPQTSVASSTQGKRHESAAEDSKDDDDTKKQLRQKMLWARRERNRASARRSNARVKEAREALLREIEETKLRVNTLRNREMTLRLENLELRKQTQYNQYASTLQSCKYEGKLPADINTTTHTGSY